MQITTAQQMRNLMEPETDKIREEDKDMALVSFFNMLEEVKGSESPCYSLSMHGGCWCSKNDIIWSLVTNHLKQLGFKIEFVESNQYMRKGYTRILWEK